MNDEQLNKIFQTARTKPDTSRAEYGFETRVLARLREPVAPWFALAWRLLPAFAAVVLVAGAWCYNERPAVTIEAAMAGSESTTVAGVFAGD